MKDINEQEKLYRDWLEHEDTGNGKLAKSTISQYISYMKAGYTHFKDLKEHDSIFCIQDYKELEEYTSKLFSEEGFNQYNEDNGNRACKSGFLQYKTFLKEQGNKSDKKDYSDVLTHNLYGVNMKNEDSALSDDNPHICIGWSVFGDLTPITDRNTLEKMYDEKYPNEVKQNRTKNKNAIWYMREDMQIGDYVVYAYDNIFNIGRVASGYRYDNTEYPGHNPDYVNNRKVEWLIKNGNRSMLHKALHTYLIGQGNKIWKMDQHRQAIYELLSGTYDKEKWDNQSAEPEKSSDNAQVYKLVYNTNIYSGFKRNRIMFGAPGTGKSFNLNKDRKQMLGDNNEADYERVTFHPEYSYANFVGTYKPVMIKHDVFENMEDAQKRIISVLTDKSRTAQEKYDLLYNDFMDNNLTRLPILIGIYSDDNFTTKKADGEATNNNNDVERNHGKALRPYLNLDFNTDSKNEISYEYVPGPFMRILVKALKSAMTDEPKPYLLLIEEINRANVAAVFGDVFQLLDRDGNGVSEFAITTSNDMRRYLAKELEVPESEVESIKIPNNMFIWATMNSADQGVFPMDTAFKRRWNFTYLGINKSAKDIPYNVYTLGKGRYSRDVTWNDIRTAINDALSSNDYNVNEDKLMGPFFIAKNDLESSESEEFINIFKDKVLMYLFEDAARQKRNTFFNKCKHIRYSDICEQFENEGVFIFPDSVTNRFKDAAIEEFMVKEDNN